MPRYRRRTDRNWEPREQRLVAEFVNFAYPGVESRTHVHLGTVQPRLRGRFTSDEDLRIVGLFRRWADALVFLPDRTVLIEAKIKPEPGVTAQLKLYARLLPNTPELEECKHKPVEKVLVCAIEDPQVSALAREENIRVVVFRPKWIEAYLDVLRPGEKTPSQSELEPTK